MANLLQDRRARILVVNDDGPKAKGIITLAKKLSEIGDVLVVVPFSAQIHPSFSITTNDTCTAIYREKQSSESIQTWAILRTPLDCVKFGLHYLCKEKMGWERPDIVVSGINHGANVGTELLYSGTIAAAFGARFESSVPAIAISQALPENIKPEDFDFSIAAEVAQHLTITVIKQGLPPNTIWNVNVPVNPKVNKRGIIECAVTKPGTLVPLNSALSLVSPKPGDKIEFSLPFRQYGEMNHPFGTDCAALQNNIVSITPLHLRPDLHSPEKASIALKNFIKFSTVLKLNMDSSWDTEHPKGRKFIVEALVDQIQEFATMDSIPIYTIEHNLNDKLFHCEHYIGATIRSVLKNHGYSETHGFQNLTRAKLTSMANQLKQAALANVELDPINRTPIITTSFILTLGVAIGILGSYYWPRLSKKK